MFVYLYNYICQLNFILNFMNKPNLKNIKIAIITFVVLGFTGMAILKGKSIIKKRRAKKGQKNKKLKKVDWYSKMFDLPEDLDF